MLTLGYLLYKFDVLASFQLLPDQFTSVAVFVAILIFCSLGLSSLRWALVVPVTKACLKIRDAFSITMIGHFFNQLLPTSIGGDAMRVWEATKIGFKTDQAVLSVLLDRLIGLSGLLIFIILGQPYLFYTSDNLYFQLVTLGLILASGLGLFLLLQLNQIAGKFTRYRIVRAGQKLSIAARQLALQHPKRLFQALFLSLCIHAVAMIAITFLARALGVSVTVYEMALIVPTVLLVSSLPISIGGWGVREAGLAAGFVVLGHDPATAVTVSILVGMINLIWAIPGMIIWILRKH